MSYFTFLDSKHVNYQSTKTIQSKLDNLRSINLINQYDLILKNLETVKGCLESEKQNFQLIGDNLLKMSDLISSLAEDSLTTVDSTVNNIRFQLEKYKEDIDNIVESSYYFNIKTIRDDADVVSTFHNVNNSSDLNKNKIQVIFYRGDSKNLGGKKVSFDNPQGYIRYEHTPIEVTDVDFENCKISTEPSEHNNFSDFSCLKLLLKGDYITLGSSNNQYSVKYIHENSIEVDIDCRLGNGITFGMEKLIGLTNGCKIVRYSYVGDVEWGKNLMEEENDNILDRENAKEHLETVATAIQQVGNTIRDVDTNINIVKTRQSVFGNLKNQLLERIQNK